MNVWDIRYLKKKGSGSGSVGIFRDWKWGIIDNCVNMPSCTVLDLGCGDLSFWEDRTCKSYIGIDSSKEITNINKLKFMERKFITNNISDFKTDDKFDVVLCLDVLFHIMDEKEFENTLRTINNIDSDIYFITNWNNSHKFKEKITDNNYQYWRLLDDYIYLLDNLELIQTHEFKGHSMYVFERD